MTLNFIVVINVVTWWIFYAIVELVYAICGAYGSQYTLCTFKFPTNVYKSYSLVIRVQLLQTYIT